MTSRSEYYVGRRVYHIDPKHKLHSHVLVAKILQVTKKGNVVVTVSDGTIETMPISQTEVYPT
jgi:hypothetical protein